MEPLFFKAENMTYGLGGKWIRMASMEPLFFKAENAALFEISETTRSLQWSRFFSKRKIHSVSPVGVDFSPRFNGAAFFQSGK